MALFVMTEQPITIDGLSARIARLVPLLKEQDPELLAALRCEAEEFLRLTTPPAAPAGGAIPAAPAEIAVPLA